MTAPASFQALSVALQVTVQAAQMVAAVRGRDAGFAAFAECAAASRCHGCKRTMQPGRCRRLAPDSAALAQAAPPSRATPCLHNLSANAAGFAAWARPEAGACECRELDEARETLGALRGAPAADSAACRRVHRALDAANARLAAFGRRSRAVYILPWVHSEEQARRSSSSCTLKDVVAGGRNSKCMFRQMQGPQDCEPCHVAKHAGVP
jgi:hypothetical protein